MPAKRLIIRSTAPWFEKIKPACESSQKNPRSQRQERIRETMITYSGEYKIVYV
jgi:hypothetical protein